jgi:hypothetical protein
MFGTNAVGKKESHVTNVTNALHNPYDFQANYTDGGERPELLLYAYTSDVLHLTTSNGLPDTQHFRSLLL